MHGYGDRRVSGGGLAVTVALHVLLLAAFLLRPHVVKQPAAAAGGAVTYVAPVAPKPQAQPERKVAPVRKRERAPERVDIARLPDTITLPNERPLPPPEPEPPKPEKAEPEQAAPVPDMADMIAARQRARARQQLAQRAEQSQAYASELPASTPGAGGTGHSSTRILSISPGSAEIEYVMVVPGRPDQLINLKVGLGGEPDIETAIVQTLVEIMQATMKPDFQYKVGNTPEVTLSARHEDRAALFAFLMKRNFPKHRPVRR